MRFSYPKEFSPNPDYRTPPVHHEVPIATVRDDMYVLTDGSLAAVFRVHGLEYDLAGVQELGHFSDLLKGVLNTLPPGMQLKMLHRIHHNYRDLLDEHERTLDGTNAYARYIAWDQLRRYRRAMTRGELLRSENLLVLTYNPQIAWWEAANKIEAILETVQGLVAPAGIVQRKFARYEQALLRFQQMLRPVENQLKLARLAPERLTDQELYGLAWDILNPRESVKRPCPPIRRPAGDDPYAGLFATPAAQKVLATHPGMAVVAPLSEREQLCVSDWKVGDKWVRIDDVYYAAISVRTLPTATMPGLALKLAAIPFECTIAIDAYMLQKQKELEKQWSDAKSEMSKAEAKMFAFEKDDKAKLQKASEREEAYLQLTGANENPFRFRVVITVSARSLQQLDERCDKILSLLRGMQNMVGMREHYAVDTLVKTAWPFSPISELNARKTITTHVANLMPLFARWDGSKRAVALFMDPLRRLVKHDPFPFNQPNRNRIIVGRSGAGKSFACQLADVQPHAARQNTEVLIVESGGSFKLTTETMGGTYLKLGPTCKYSINPMDLPVDYHKLPADQQEAELRVKTAFIKNLALAMARIMDPQLQQLAESVLGAVAQRTYKLAFERSETARFRDFYRVLGQYTNPKDRRAEEFAGQLMTALAPYVDARSLGGDEGIFSRYFDCFTDLDVNNTVMCFDLIDIKGDEGLLTPMSLVTLGSLIYNRLMRRDGVERMVVVDEAWALIKAGRDGEETPAGKIIELLFREGRKLGGGTTMISQNLADMTGDKVGLAVTAQSPLQYFLVHQRGSKDNDDAFRSQGFSDEKMDRVYNLKTAVGEYSEIMLREGEEWGVVQLPSVGMKYWLATTDPKDDVVKNRYLKTYHQGCGLDLRAVIAILAEDYPGGVHTAPADHREMDQQTALQFAERWRAQYEQFAGYVARGEPVPGDFGAAA